MEQSRGRKIDEVWEMIVLCVALLIHLVAIFYEGWPCGSLISHLCLDWSIEMQIVMSLLVFSSMLLILAVIFNYMALRGDKSPYCLRINAVALVFMSSLISISALIYYNHRLLVKFWCHYLVGLGAGMSLATALLQFQRVS